MGRVHDWNHCPRCGARVRAQATMVSCGDCEFVAYGHSDPTVCAIVTDGEGRVLLCRRAVEPRAGAWDLPGGFLEEGEQPVDGLRRELLEETGLEIEPLELLGVWLDRYGEGEAAPWTLNLYWTARVVGGEPQAADDVAELGWFPLDALPPDAELAFANVAQALRSVGR